jgi:hypothetical protein
MLLRKHTHVYADISTNIGRFALYKSAPLEWMLYKVKVWAGGLEKVLFGSDYPFYFQKETLESLEMARDCLNKNFENFITDDDMKESSTRIPRNSVKGIDYQHDSLNNPLTRRLKWQKGIRQKRWLTGFGKKSKRANLYLCQTAVWDYPQNYRKREVPI